MLLPKKDLEEMAAIHPEILEFVAKNPMPPMSQEISALRNMMEVMDKKYNTWTGPAFTGSETYHDIEMRDGFMSSLKIQKPASGPPGPLIVLAFGGGFVGGDNNQFTKTGRVLVNVFGATVVSIGYRLAPEFKFPMSQHDSLDSLIWIANNATDPIINSDPKKGFIMGGVSAGAATTAAFSRLFQEEPLSHPLTGQWLCIPSVMDASHVPDRFKDYYLSTEQQAKNPFFSKESRERLAAITGWDIKSPLRYAMNSKTPFSGQPRTYFQVAGADPLRDDALIYDEFLSEAGVKTKVDIYPGCPHGHMMAFPTLEVAKKTNIDTIVGFGWLLGKEIAHEDAAKELGL